MASIDESRVQRIRRTTEQRLADAEANGSNDRLQTLINLGLAGRRAIITVPQDITETEWLTLVERMIRFARRMRQGESE